MSKDSVVNKLEDKGENFRQDAEHTLSPSDRQQRARVAFAWTYPHVLKDLVLVLSMHTAPQMGEVYGEHGNYGEVKQTNNSRSSSNATCAQIEIVPRAAFFFSRKELQSRCSIYPTSQMGVLDVALTTSLGFSTSSGQG